MHSRLKDPVFSRFNTLYLSLTESHYIISQSTLSVSLFHSLWHTFILIDTFSLSVTNTLSLFPSYSFSAFLSYSLSLLYVLSLPHTHSFNSSTSLLPSQTDILSFVLSLPHLGSYIELHKICLLYLFVKYIVGQWN